MTPFFQVSVAAPSLPCYYTCFQNVGSDFRLGRGYVATEGMVLAP